MTRQRVVKVTATVTSELAGKTATCPPKWHLAGCVKYADGNAETADGFVLRMLQVEPVRQCALRGRKPLVAVNADIRRVGNHA